MKKIVIILILCSSFNLFGQVSIGNINPDPSAILDLSNKLGKGFLVPRMTTNERISIMMPAEGLSVYDIEVEGFCYYTASIGWVCIRPNGTNAWVKSSDVTAYADGPAESITRTGNVIITTNSYQIKIEESGGIILKNNSGTALISLGSDGKVILNGSNGGKLAVH